MQTITIAHRGAAFQAPENTMAAFRLAQELGMQWLEFDVQLSADGVPVVIHDASVDRTTDESGLVAEYSYSELRELDAGSWFANEFSAEKIPSLQKMVMFLQKNKLNANIEIKDPTATEITCNLLKKMHFDFANNLISSFSSEVITAARKLLPQANLSIAVEIENPTDWQNRKAEYQKIITENQCYGLVINLKALKSLGKAAFELGQQQLFCYTAQDEETAEWCLQQGVSVFRDI